MTASHYQFQFFILQIFPKPSLQVYTLYMTDHFYFLPKFYFYNSRYIILMYLDSLL